LTWTPELPDLKICCEESAKTHTTFFGWQPALPVMPASKNKNAPSAKTEVLTTNVRAKHS